MCIGYLLREHEWQDHWHMMASYWMPLTRMVDQRPCGVLTWSWLLMFRAKRLDGTGRHRWCLLHDLHDDDPHDCLCALVLRMMYPQAGRWAYIHRWACGSYVLTTTYLSFNLGLIALQARSLDMLASQLELPVADFLAWMI